MNVSETDEHEHYRLQAGSTHDEMLVMYNARMRRLLALKARLVDARPDVRRALNLAALALHEAHAGLLCPLDRNVMREDLDAMEAALRVPIARRLEAAHACGTYLACLHAFAAWQTAVLDEHDDRARKTAATLLQAGIDETAASMQQWVRSWLEQGHLYGTDVAQVWVEHSGTQFRLRWRERAPGEPAPPTTSKATPNTPL